MMAITVAESLAKGDVATWVLVAGLLVYTASYDVSIVTRLKETDSYGRNDNMPSYG